MNIQEIKPSLGPRLQDMGIQLRPGTSSQPSARASATPASSSAEPQESLSLAGLQLVDLGKAYLVVEDQQEQPFEIDLQRLNPEKLMQSLQQLGNARNLGAALDVQNQVSELVQAMRQAHNLPDTPQENLKVIIEGAFGSLELDLSKLNPEALQSLFAEDLASQSSQNLQAQHQQLAGLSHMIRAGFSDSAELDLAQARQWVDLAQQSLGLLDFISQLLGYNPLNEEQAVRALLQQSDTPNSSDPASVALLSERTLALIEAANRLGESLELAPQPDSPDVLELLRAFLAILRQLEHDMAALQAEQNQNSKLERQLLADFSRRQRADLQFHQDQLQSLDMTAQQRLMLGLNHSLQRLEAWAWLNSQRPHPPELEAMLRQLGQRQIAVI